VCVAECIDVSIRYEFTDRRGGLQDIGIGW
jgi:hypothetical protein